MAARMSIKRFLSLLVSLPLLLALPLSLACCTAGGEVGKDADKPETMEPLANGSSVPVSLVCKNGENRVVFVYSADRALKGKLVCGAQSLDIYLTAGLHVRTGFLLPAGCGEVTSMTLSACRENETASFALYDASLDTQTVTAGVVKLENGKYALGADLDRGGALVFFDDLQDGGKYGNLINVYDAGRLIQQSYYGTSEPPYETAVFAGKPCPYNPVQAGDQYNNLSHLVDCEITDTAISVKCQPLDWPKKKSLTPAYMENTYTLTDGCAKAENRFTDFSGYDNSSHGQEIPAFYTVAALNRFVFADKRWKEGAELTFVDGIGSYYDGNSRAFDLATKETWGAWADADGYAFGVYTPGITGLVLSRNEPNGTSASDRSNASSYIGATKDFAIFPYKTYSYSYLLAAGDIGSVRSAFMAEKDFTDNADLRWYPGLDGADPAYLSIDFTKDFVKDKIWGEHHLTYAFTGEGLKLTCQIDGTADPYFYVDYDARISCEDVTTLTIEYRCGANNSSSAKNLQLFYCTDGDRYASADKATGQFPLETDGGWHTLEIPLKGYAFWKGSLNGLRFDFFTSAETGDTFTVRSVKLN